MKKYAGVIVRKEDKCLFCKRNADMSKFAGEWSIPGGSVEKGEGIPHAAQREFYEETNVELEAGWHKERVEEHNKMVKEDNIQLVRWAYAPPSINDEPEYQVVLTSLKRFEELGYDARVVFWFDN